MTPTTALTLSITDEPPSLADFDVKQREQHRFLGTDGTFVVIGSSHYIGVPELGYHELLSCKEDLGSAVEQVPLRAGYSSQVTREIDGLAVTSQLTVQPLDAFPGPDDCDVAYRFGPEAYTTIDRRCETAYETYHTYPEHDIAVRTENRFEAEGKLSVEERVRNPVESPHRHPADADD
jgi:hypothetical protein